MCLFLSVKKSFSEALGKLLILPQPESCQIPWLNQILGKGKWVTMIDLDEPGLTHGNVDRIHFL